MAQYANAIIAKARAMYGRMLTPAQYDDLLRKQNVQEISAYLREKTPYARALEGVQDSTIHRGQLENLLNKDLFYQYVRLAKYVRQKDSIYQFVIADAEIELLLACLRNIAVSRQADLLAELPTFVQPFVSFGIMDLMNVKTVEQLYQVVKHTGYGPVIRHCMEKYPPIDGEFQYAAYGVALRKYYFQMMLRRTQGTEHGESAKQMHEIITIRAELMNLNTIYRLKTYFNTPPDEIRKLLLPFYCKLNKRKMDVLIDTKDAQSFMRALCRTVYGKRLREDEPFIESQTDSVRYVLNLRMLHFSTSPQVVYVAFMMLRRMEIEDIIRITEGVRYKLPPDQIERVLYKV